MAQEIPSLALQRSRNERTVNLWESYAQHRAHLMRLILAASDPSRKLCVLGAGNCNDLDLPALLIAFREVTLVDWDQAALNAGITRQIAEIPRNLRALGSVELTGLLPQLTPDASANAATIERFLTTPSRPDLSSFGAFDVVVSACVLSQILDAANQAAGASHPRAFDFAIALRQQHLRLMSDSLTSDGRGLLITDIVSSDTSPELFTCKTEQDLRPLTRQLLQAGNFFKGLHPGQLFLDLPGAKSPPGSSDAPQMSDPWIWTMGSRRFLVLAASFQRPSNPQS